MLQSVTGIDGESANLYGCGQYEIGTDKILITRYNPMPMDRSWFTYTPKKTSDSSLWNTWKYIIISGKIQPALARDIAYEPKSSTPGDGMIWIACGDDATTPVKAFRGVDTTWNAKVKDSIPASIGIGADIYGLAFEKSDRRYLWVSNMTKKQIYKVDLDGVTGVNSHAFQDQPVQNICVNTNPVSPAVTIAWSGFTNSVTLTIVSLNGKVVYSQTVTTGKFIWDGTNRNGIPVSKGVYFAKIADSDNRSAVTRIIVR